MTSTKLAYAPSSAVTITLSSLASDSNLLAGRQSAAIDNSANLYVDYLIAGHVKMGTTPTAGKAVEVHVIAMQDDTNWPDVLDGTDAAKTLTTSDIKNAICRQAASIPTDSTTGRVLPFGPVSVAALFGGVCPRKFVAFVVHSAVAALDATAGNHVLAITPAYYTNG